MITTEYTNHKGMNVFGLSWIFVNTNPITLMEQLKNVPSKFMVIENKNPCKFLTYRDLFLGCPDGLEPSTFRTTSNGIEHWESPLYIAVSED